MNNSDILSKKLEAIEHDMVTLDFFLQSLKETFSQAGTQDVAMAARIVVSAHEKARKILPELAKIREQLKRNGLESSE